MMNSPRIPVSVPETLDIEGYASLFRIRDQSGDMIMPGAFRRSLVRRGASSIRMLFQHDPGQPIGMWTDIAEDQIGLRVRGKLNLKVQRAAELAELLKQGTANGLSIGFRTVSARQASNRKQRSIDQIDLWEVSLVTFPMLAGAQIMRIGAAA